MIMMEGTELLTVRTITASRETPMSSGFACITRASPAVMAKKSTVTALSTLSKRRGTLHSFQESANAMTRELDSREYEEREGSPRKIRKT
ncbi:hypothetical protein Trydic_g3571 [Trypoxylus dichotomus]